MSFTNDIFPDIDGTAELPLPTSSTELPSVDDSDNDTCDEDEPNKKFLGCLLTEKVALSLQFLLQTRPIKNWQNKT